MQLGFQCVLSVNDGVAAAQATFSDHAIVTLPDQDVTDHEYATHGQSDFYFRLLPGLIKNGKLKVEVYHSAALWARVFALLRTSKTWFVQESPPSPGPYVAQKFQFTGYVSKLPGSVFERDGIQMFSFEVSVSGPWTISGGS